MKVHVIFHSFLIFIFSSLVVCQECQDKFVIGRFGVQQSLSQQIFLTIENIGIQQCSRECLLRTKCKAVAYKLGNLKCYLGDDDDYITTSLYREDLASPRSKLVQFENQLLKSCLGHSCDESSVCVELSNGTSTCVSTVPNTLTIIQGQTVTGCGIIPIVPGANTPTSTERSVGTVLTYSCQAGLVTKGNPNTTCQSNGQWSAMTYTCTNCNTTYFVFNEDLNFCYRIENSKRNTYLNAILHCISMGGKLAKVDSSEKIAAIIGNLDEQSYVDGSDEAKDGIWLHSDGTVVNMDLFKSGSPKAGDTNCLSLRADLGKLLDISCTLNKFSICEQL